MPEYKVLLFSAKSLYDDGTPGRRAITEGIADAVCRVSVWCWDCSIPESRG